MYLPGLTLGMLYLPSLSVAIPRLVPSKITFAPISVFPLLSYQQLPFYAEHFEHLSNHDC